MAAFDTVLTFWFGSATGQDPSAETQKRWWTKSDEFDATVRETFGDLHASLMSGASSEWQDTPRGCLARVIVFDQFSRNMFRNTAEAFASDPLAVATTDRILEREMLTELGLHEQLFALMPLMHAESRERQAQSVKQFEALAARCPDESFVRNVDYAYRHKRIIDRFGRYPHRNAIVGRDSTAEELAFLEEPGSSF